MFGREGTARLGFPGVELLGDQAIESVEDGFGLGFRGVEDPVDITGDLGPFDLVLRLGVGFGAGDPTQGAGATSAGSP